MTIKEFAQYRMRYAVTMPEIAKEMGVSKSYINNIEKQNASNEGISEETMQKLLKALYTVVQNRNKPQVTKKKA